MATNGMAQWLKTIEDSRVQLHTALQSQDHEQMTTALGSCLPIHTLRKGQLNTMLPGIETFIGVYTGMVSAVASCKTSAVVWVAENEDIRDATPDGDAVTPEVRAFTPTYWIWKFVTEANGCKATLRTELLETAKPRGGGVFSSGKYVLEDYKFSVVASWGHIDLSTRGLMAHPVAEERKEKRGT